MPPPRDWRLTRDEADRLIAAAAAPPVLRHTAATWMAIAGVPMNQISRLLGHTDPRVTMRVYAKHSPDYLRGAVDVLTG